MSHPVAQSQTTASQPAQSLLPDSTSIFTTGSFVLIAVLAVLVVLGLLYGARLRRRRHRAEHELIAHNEALHDEGVADASLDVAGEEEPSPAAPPPAPPAPPISPVPAPPAARVPEPLDDEPIAAATPAFAENLAVEAAPAAPPAPAGPPPADGPVDQLKGLGPRVAERLAQQGITTVGQLAALTDDQAAALDAHLGPFTGRMARDRWLEQARFLAAGDRAGFEAVFGRL